MRLGRASRQVHPRAFEPDQSGCVPRGDVEVPVAHPSFGLPYRSRAHGTGSGQRDRSTPGSVGGARGRALARHRPRLRAADGARAAAVPDRAAAGRGHRARRGAARGRLLHGPARQRRLPLRRPRAGQVVRRRHRLEVDQVRPRAEEPADGRDGDAAARLRAARRCTDFGSASRSRSPGTARSTT